MIHLPNEKRRYKVFPGSYPEGKFLMIKGWMLPFTRAEIQALPEEFRSFPMHLLSLNERSFSLQIQGKVSAVRVAEILYFSAEKRRVFARTETARLPLKMTMEQVQKLTAPFSFTLLRQYLCKFGMG